MKNIFFSILFLLVFTQTAHTQMVTEREVPEAVRAVAQEQNKGKKISMWTLHQDRGKYIASYIDDKEIRMIDVSLDGKWISTRQGILPENMPEAVMTAAKAAAKEKFHKRYELFNYFYVTGPDMTGCYMINASPKNDTKFITLFFDQNGKMLEKQ